MAGSGWKWLEVAGSGWKYEINPKRIKDSVRETGYCRQIPPTKMLCGVLTGHLVSWMRFNTFSIAASSPSLASWLILGWWPEMPQDSRICQTPYKLPSSRLIKLGGCTIDQERKPMPGNSRCFKNRISMVLSSSPRKQVSTALPALQTEPESGDPLPDCACFAVSRVDLGEKLLLPSAMCFE